VFFGDCENKAGDLEILIFPAGRPHFVRLRACASFQRNTHHGAAERNALRLPSAAKSLSVF
jgi:hypothetical protein